MSILITKLSYIHPITQQVQILCAEKVNVHSNLSTKIKNILQSFYGLSAAQYTQILSSLHFPQLKNMSAKITQDSMHEVRQNMADENKGIGEAIKIDSEIENFIYKISQNSETTYADPLYRYKEIIKCGDEITQDIHNYAEQLIGQKLEINEANFVFNPRAETWHYDKPNSNDLVFTLPLKCTPTEYIAPKYSASHFIAHEVVEHWIEPRSNSNIQSIAQNSKPHCMSVLRGYGPKLEKQSPIYKSMLPLIHRSPLVEGPRTILLIRFTLAS